MRTFTFKGLFLTVLFMLLGSTAILAADDGLNTTQVTIKLDEAGTLPNKIAVSRKNLITNLKIVGKINGTDLKFIREMAGCDFNREKTDGKLSILELSEVKIVAGGDAYVRYDENYYTSNDKLGDFAFAECSGLTSLTLPSSVTSIGDGVFSGCRGLTSLTIPSGVTSIGDYAFSGCSGLTSLTIPSGVTSIGDLTFNGCSGLTSLTIPSGVTSIGDMAFEGCRGLTSMTIPSSVTSIGKYAFEGCRGLTSMTIPSSVTSIGNYAFIGCSGLTSLTLPSSVTSIGDGVFIGCSGLTSMTIPSSVTSIGESAFRDCSGLTSLTLPSSVTSISNRAFYGCSGLTSIYAYLEKIPKLGSDVFTGCDAKNCILYVPTGTYDDYWVSEFGYFENIVDGINKDGLLTTQVTIKLDEAGTLPSKISANEKNLITNLKIVGKINGTDLKFIREMAGCDFNWKKTDGKLSILDLSEAKIVAGGDAYVRYGDNHYTSNDKLGDYVFCDCSGLTSLTIPSGVTSIGNQTFQGCSGLTSLTLLSGVTSIGNCAFDGCSGLTSLTIPSGVTSIGWGAFADCSGLTSLTLPSGVTSIGDLTFEGCSGLTSLTIPSGVTSIGIRAFRGCSGLTSLTLPSGVTSIGGAAFDGCSGLTSLTIPSGVTSIGDKAFYGCSGLTSLTIPSSVTSIGDGTFSGCSGLTSLTLPSGVTSIGGYAFRACSGLISIYVYPENLPELGTGIFDECDAKNCTVYVPKGTYDAYKSSEFGYFENIVDGINKDGLLTTQVTIKLDEAGTLPSKISANEKNLITNLKIVGKINGTDLKFIREMAGCDFNWKKTDGKLSILDLSEAKIVAGGDAYVQFSNNYYTYNDELGDYAFYGCSGLTSLIIPSSVTSIGGGTFKGCSGLTSMIIPSGVTSIGGEAFYGCSGLTSLTIPSSVTEIGELAFEGCSGLTSMTIPSSVTSIGWGAFAECSGLTSLTIPSSVTSIDRYTFAGCCGLTSLTIPSSVTSIGNYAFADCSGLTSIYACLEKIPTLGSNVFKGCDAKNCILYVPKGTYDAYKSSEFGYFEKIVEFDATGIDKVTTSADVKEVSRYSANGQRLSAPAKGLNIVKYSDGSVKKVVVQ